LAASAFSLYFFCCFSPRLRHSCPSFFAASGTDSFLYLYLCSAQKERYGENLRVFFFFLFFVHSFRRNVPVRHFF